MVIAYHIRMITAFEHDNAALNIALEEACHALALPGLSHGGAAATRERLTAALLQLAHEGVRDAEALCAGALARVTPSTAYYARQVR